MNKLILLSLVISVFSLMSCKSEYEERLALAKELKKELDQASGSEGLVGETLQFEINELKEQINYQARVSGNEQLFFKELYD